jgi:hypothetical protein
MKIIKLGTVNDIHFYAMKNEYDNYVKLNEHDLEYQSPDAVIYFDSGIHAMSWEDVIAHYCERANKEE